MFSSLRKWQNVARFSASRLSDYANLAAVELEIARQRLLRDLMLYSLLGLSAMFGLAFVCVAVIVSAASTPYLIETTWAVAGFWVLVGLGAFVAVRRRDAAGAFQALQDTWQRDIEAIRESLR